MTRLASRIIKAGITTCLLFAFINLNAQTAPASGDGTQSNPYEIATLQNLIWLSQSDTVWNKFFIQTADIDADTLSSWNPIGNTTTNFSGSYNGNGFSISNMTINRPGQSHSAIFGFVRGADQSHLSVIKNIKIHNINVISGDYAGSLCGRSEFSIIDSCFADGNITGNNFVGGLVGRHYGQGSGYHVEMRNSASTCNVSGQQYIGGITGVHDGSNNGYALLEKCFFDGTVHCTNIGGGIVGLIYGSSGHDTIRNTYCFGTVYRDSTTNTNIGAFSGLNLNGHTEYCYSVCNVLYNNSTVTNKGFCASESSASNISNFFDNTATNQSSGTGATAKTTTQLNNPCTFISAGWDFKKEDINGTNDNWQIDDTNHYYYPFLGIEDSLVFPEHFNAMNFDGINDYIAIESNSKIDLTNNYTLEAWIKPKAFSSMDGIISKYQNNSANGYTLRLSHIAPYNGLEFDQKYTQSGILDTNRWYHVAAINNNGIRSLYLNGTQQTLSGIPVTISSNTDSLCIGVDYNISGRYFEGDIDEVRIWDTVRTECEIQGYMYTELTGSEPGLAAYFNFNEGIPNYLNSCFSNEIINIVDTFNGAPVHMSFTDSVSNYIPQNPAIIGTGIYYNTIAPVILSYPFDQLVFSDAQCFAVLPDFTDSIIATDNCDTNIFYSQTPAAGTTIFDSTIVWLYASDVFGNTDSVWFYTLVTDTTSPVINCIGNQIINLAQGETFYTVQGNEFDASASDNCSVDTIYNSLNSGNTIGGEQLSAGTHLLTWYAIDESGNIDSCSFEVIVNLFDGIDEVSNNLSVYPNPADNFTKVSADKMIDMVEIYDLSGRLIQAKVINSKTAEINTRGLANGTYFLKIIFPESSREIKLIVE